MVYKIFFGNLQKYILLTMNILKYSIPFLILGSLLVCCATYTPKKVTTHKEEPVVIANDSLAYEITIIDIGFNLYLNSIAKPVGFYSQSYLENRNIFYVTEWNNRVRNPQQYNRNIYENIIDYQSNIDYGYDVNYKLFNYFEFAQQKYQMNLGVSGKFNR